jgi:hypothetical protein
LGHYIIGGVAADLSTHLCQFRRCGIDVDSLLEELIAAEYSGLSARSLLKDRQWWSAALFAIHMKELSPDWWERTKATLEADTETDIAQFIGDVDAAGPCERCPADLKFKTQTVIEDGVDQLPAEEDELGASARLDEEPDPTTNAPATHKLRSIMSTAFHRLLRKPNAQRDIESDPGDH